ncbi:hypothetical protein BDBG_03629 [Blastomyces gilchristii SLH14081]|uniref:Uncharacterized protein n=1 Tax=Blastomyces gilchristii (strain SLH14081) TaxID=559298 RepID=A0A179UKA7_BLAGS|nr:uncharacterized protein BDBG_03629 [Blastomyces gilchristii SLH14081]OAT07587.1 hypothetical protein BDBG_03629 [Blastomyces gilchristii SLH14081]
MFEDFSFSSPRRKNRDSLIPSYDEDMVIACEDHLISPFSSRSPSPVPRCRNSKDHPLLPRHSRQPFQLGPAPTSIPYNYGDRHGLSIRTLTKKLNAQTLDNDANSDSDVGPALPITPPRSAHTDVPAIWLESEPLSPPYREHDDNSSWTGPSPTSTPRFIESRRTSHSEADNLPYAHYASITTQDKEQFSSLRQHRENLSLLQCTAKTVAETVRIALLLEESDRLSFDEIDEDRHPSSLSHLPASRNPTSLINNHSRNPTRRSSTSTEPALKSKLSISNTYRVDKSRHSPRNSSHTSDFRIIEKSSRGLRRRSLVLAAVTAMVQAEALEKGQRDRELRDIRRESSRAVSSDFLHSLSGRLKDSTTANSS